MSKADDAFSTPAPTSKSRRAVILGAGGIAAVGALSTAALALPTLSIAGPSPELFAWRKARAACRLVWDTAGDTELVQLVRTLKYCDWERPNERRSSVFKTIADGAGRNPTLKAIAAAEVREEASRAALLHRPVCSSRDIAERVEVLRAEREWQEGRETYDRYIACPELDALFTAIETMAKGGTHV